MPYLVWVHPKSGGSDYAYRLKDEKTAKSFYQKAVKSKRFALVEKPVKTRSSRKRRR